MTRACNGHGNHNLLSHDKQVAYNYVDYVYLCGINVYTPRNTKCIWLYSIVTKKKGFFFIQHAYKQLCQVLILCLLCTLKDGPVLNCSIALSLKLYLLIDKMSVHHRHLCMRTLVHHRCPCARQELCTSDPTKGRTIV